MSTHRQYKCRAAHIQTNKSSTSHSCMHTHHLSKGEQHQSSGECIHSNLPPSILWFPRPANTTQPLGGKRRRGRVGSMRKGKKRRGSVSQQTVPACWHPQHLIIFIFITSAAAHALKAISVHFFLFCFQQKTFTTNEGRTLKPAANIINLELTFLAGKAQSSTEVITLCFFCPSSSAGSLHNN